MQIFSEFFSGFSNLLVISQTDDNYVNAQISDTAVQVNACVVYLQASSIGSPENYPARIRLILEDASHKTIYSINDVFGEYAYVDTNGDGGADAYKSPTPIYITIPEGIEAKYVQLEVWSVHERDVGDEDVKIAELEVYKSPEMGSVDTKICSYSDTEFISRFVETTDEDQWPGFRFDNGDSRYDDEEDIYMSRPIQSGAIRVTLGVSKNDARNQAMRYNFYYTVPIQTQTQQPNYMMFHREYPYTFWDLWAQIEDFLFLILVVAAINIAGAYISGVTGQMWVWRLVQRWDVVIIMMMVEEFRTTGKFGGWMETALYRDEGINGSLFRFFYHNMLDWDGTLARGTIPYIEASADYIRHYHW